MDEPRIGHEKAYVINPKPYFQISFECGNRGFYNVKEDLYDLAESIGIEIQDGYITEECDYEGDLERIIIYNGGRESLLAKSVLEFYGITPSEVPDGMTLHLVMG